MTGRSWRPWTTPRPAGVRLQWLEQQATAGASVPSIVVRDASPADHEHVRAVLVASYAQYRDVLGPTLHDVYLDDLCDLDQRLAGGQLLVATVDDAVVGTVTLHSAGTVGDHAWPAQWAAIRALGVDPSGRTHGVGRGLVEAAAARARRTAAHTLGLHTGEFMTAAIRLYERMGFTRVPELDLDAAELIDTHGARAPRVLAYHLPLRRRGRRRGPSRSLVAQ